MDNSKIKNNIITPCGHSFCFKCFMKWNEENESCPYCRKRIAKKQTRIEYIEIENVVEQEIIVEQEIVVYPSLKDYCYHLFSETIQLCIKNKDNIILLYLSGLPSGSDGIFSPHLQIAPLRCLGLASWEH